MDQIKSNKNIEGPVNVARLEKDGKVFYTFFDFHLPVTDQIKCPSIYFKPFITYLIENFNLANDQKRDIDFFMEIHPTQLPHNISIHKSIHIHEVQDMFAEYFKIEKNKVIRSKEFPNVRFHYFDIRDYTIGTDVFRALAQTQNTINTYVNITMQDLDQFRNVFEIALSTMIVVTNQLLQATKAPTIKTATVPPNVQQLMQLTKEQIRAKSSHIINKILHQYSNSDIQKKIHNIIQRILPPLLNDMQTGVNELLDTINKYTNILTTQDINTFMDDDKTDIASNPYGPNWEKVEQLMSQIRIGINRFISIFHNIHSFIIDLYLLRRFLDKSYVTNAVCYSGGYHSLDYIEFLVKDFGFTLTHASVHIENLSTVQKKIKSSKDYLQTTAMLLTSRYLTQCSDLSSFPLGFR